MAKPILIVRGPIGAEAGQGIDVIVNPQIETHSKIPEVVPYLNADDLLFIPPGETNQISLGDFKKRQGL